MKNYALRNLGAGMLCVSLLLTTPHFASAQAAKDRNRGVSSKRSKATNPSRKLFERGRELRDRLGAPSDHHFHLYAQFQPLNGQPQEIIGSPSGMFPVIIHERGRMVDFNVYFPQAKAGEPALVRTLDEGSLVPLQRRIAGAKKGNQTAEGKSDARPVRGRNQLAVAVKADGRLGFRYRYGQDRHAQRIEIRLGKRRAYLNLHLHLPGEDH